jgi:hypothetical protein
VIHLGRGVDRDLLLENDVQQGAKAVAAAAETRRTGGSNIAAKIGSAARAEMPSARSRGA